MKKTNHKKVGKEIWFYARVILIVLILLFPFIIMLSISFKATADDISETLKKYKDYVGHIHIAENHRYQPGTGSIDWKRHMETLKEIGYEGPVVNEGRIRGEDPLKVYQESVNFMKQFM